MEDFNILYRSTNNKVEMIKALPDKRNCAETLLDYIDTYKTIIDNLLYKN